MIFKDKDLNKKELLKKLSEIVDQQTFLSFFRDSNVITFDNEIVYLILQTSNDVKYIKKNFYEKVQTAINHVFGINKVIEIISYNEFELISSKKSNKKNNDNDSNLNENLNFENYIEVDFNRDIIELGKKILLQNKTCYNPIFIYSPSGLGKTHFLNALGNELVNKQKKVCYINPDQFIKKITQFLINSDQEKLAEIIEYYKNFDYLLFDDIQQFGSKTATLNILFNIINFSIENEKQIVIASDKSPDLLGGFEERFITRFQGGITQELSTPSLNDLMIIFKTKLKKLDIDPIDWEDEAIKFIVRNHSSSIRKLEGAINKIEWNKQKNIQNVKYTYNVVSQMFSTISKDNKKATPETILEVVAKYYKVQKNDIVGKSRKKELALARHISMWMIRNLTNLSYKEIGKMFKGRDHTTIMASIKKIDYLIKVNEIVKNTLKSIKEELNDFNF